MDEALTRTELFYFWVGDQPEGFALESTLLHKSRDGLIELQVFWSRHQPEWESATILNTVRQGDTYGEEGYLIGYDGIQLALPCGGQADDSYLELGLHWRPEYPSSYRLLCTRNLPFGHEFIWRNSVGAEFLRSVDLQRKR